MRKLSVVSVLILSISGIAVAQFPRTTLEKVRQIRLLESTREDVKRILYDYEASDDNDHSQEFSNDDVDIEISYSRGACADDPDDDDASRRWKVSEWKVVKIEIEPTDSIKPEDVGFNLSKFIKEQRYANVTDSYIQHDKTLGAAFEADKDGISKIFLFPPTGAKKKMCTKNEAAKKFYQLESWFGDSKLEDRPGGCGNLVANVIDLTLSAAEVGASSSKTISVISEATDPENDVLTYVYVVSGGQIRGQGANVSWDLTALAPGTYTITAGVDDGCGICGKTMTKTVVIK